MQTNTAVPLTRLDIGDLARWAAEQPREKSFEFISNTNCAVAQYLRARGVEFRAVLGSWVEFHDGTSTDPWSLDVSAALQCRPGTFGELADALAAIVAEQCS